MRGYEFEGVNGLRCVVDSADYITAYCYARRYLGKIRRFVTVHS